MQKLAGTARLEACDPASFGEHAGCDWRKEIKEQLPAGECDAAS